MPDVALPFSLTNGTTADATQVMANFNAIVTALNDIDQANFLASFIDALAPAGRVQGFARADTPTGWLLCDGSAVSRATYAKLFTAIGTTYGNGDGATTFNLPDYRGRMLVGLGTHADVDALTDNDALAVGSRRTKHKHTTPANAGGIPMVNMDTVAGTSSPWSGDDNFAGAANGGGHNHGSYAIGIGPNSGAEPTDTPAYHTVRFLISTGF